MNSKRLSLSLLALIGSVFLFVAASFAWFAVSEIINVGDTVVFVQDIDVTATLYVSSNGVDYTEATNIDFQTTIPGDIIYYKLVIFNNNDFEISTQVALNGFTDGVADPGGDDTNYLEGRSLLDVLLLNASNDVDLVTITDTTLSSLLTTSTIITHQSVSIQASSSAELYFSFTVSPTLAGSDYENLILDIDHLYVRSAS